MLRRSDSRVWAGHALGRVTAALVRHRLCRLLRRWKAPQGQGQRPDQDGGEGEAPAAAPRPRRRTRARLSSYTVRDAVESWLAHGLTGREVSTVVNRTILARTHVIPALGARKLAQLLAEEVDEWLATKAKTLSTDTLHRLCRSCASPSVVRRHATWSSAMSHYFVMFPVGPLAPRRSRSR
jgi:hypothetical protein